MGTKFISGIANVQAPLIKKDTVFGSKVSANMDMLRNDQSRHVSPAVMAAIKYLSAEGWEVKMHPEPKVYADNQWWPLSEDWLLGCDYSEVPQPLANDIMDVMKAEGFCP